MGPPPRNETAEEDETERDLSLFLCSREKVTLIHSTDSGRMHSNLSADLTALRTLRELFRVFPHLHVAVKADDLPTPLRLCICSPSLFSFTAASSIPPSTQPKSAKRTATESASSRAILDT